MPPSSNRMTKNRAQPTRYRPGKAETQDAETSSEDEESASDNEERNAVPQRPVTRPAATSFPAKQQERKKLAIDARKVGAQASLPVSHSRQAGKEGGDDLEGFVTASESSASGDERSDDEAEAESASSDSEQEEDDDDDEDSSSSSEEEAKKPMLRPTFLSKAQRLKQTSTTTTSISQTPATASQDPSLRQQKADDLLRIQLERDAAAKAAGKKSWDDEDFAPEEEVDDTDNLDPETEYAAWKLRELKRVRRERLLIEEREKEREEVERRRNLTAEEREAEDRAYVAAQQQAAEEGEEGGRGKMGYMQKYFHGGAFFNSEAGGRGESEPDAEVQAALNRSFAGAKFEDETGDKSVLPQYMRIRDMTRLGRKGRTKYQDLKSEDTGRWGAETGRRREDGGGGDARGLDERFRPDDSGRERERTGANATAVGERRRFEGESGGRDEKRARYG